MRNIICTILGHHWRLEQRQQHFGVVETITLCDRCGERQRAVFDAETGGRRRETLPLNAPSAQHP